MGDGWLRVRVGMVLELSPNHQMGLGLMRLRPGIETEVVEVIAKQIPKT